MKESQHTAGLASASIVSVLVEVIEADKRFAPKYKTANNCDELLLVLAEALVCGSRILMKCIQGDEDLKKPNQRLFCECLEINRKGLLEEFGSKLSHEEASRICNQTSAFACAVFSNLTGLTNAKESLLEHLNNAYLENSGLEVADTTKRLFEIAGKDITARSVAELLFCLNKKPWLIAEPDDFVKYWKQLSSGI